MGRLVAFMGALDDAQALVLGESEEHRHEAATHGRREVNVAAIQDFDQAPPPAPLRQAALSTRLIAPSLAPVQTIVLAPCQKTVLNPRTQGGP